MTKRIMLHIIVGFCTILLAPLHAGAQEATFSPSALHSARTSFSDWYEKSKAPAPYITHIFTIDFGVLFKGLSHQGLGLGLQYEQQIIPHLALKGYFGHTTFNTGYHGLYCTTVSLGGYAVWYPFSRQLRGFYVDAGGGFDYVAYFRRNGEVDDYMKDEASGMNLFTRGDIGYKFSLPLNFLLDVSVGYKFVHKADSVFYGSVGDVLSDGIQWGFKIKHIIK